MTSLMKGDAALLIGSHHLGLLLQSAYYSIYGIKEILLAYRKAVPDAFEKVNDFSYLKHPYAYGFHEVNPTGISYAA